MALLEFSGFDDQTNFSDLVAVTQTANNPWQWSINEGGSLVPGRFGGKALRLGVGTGGTLSSPLTTGIVGSAVKMPSASRLDIIFWDSATQNPSILDASSQCTVRLVTTGGLLEIWKGPANSGVLQYRSGANFFPAEAWFFLAIQPTIGSSGSMGLEFNGTTLAAISGIDTQAGAATTFDSIAWSGSASSNPLIDDLYIEDLTTGPGSNPFNTFQGQLRVFTRFPNGAGAAADFTPLSGANYTQVREHAMDGDTSYNVDTTSTVGDKDLFTADPLPAGAVPLACKVKLASRQDGSGGRAIETLLKSGSTIAAGASTTLFQSYTYQGDVYPLDPNGNIDWTKASVDASQIGYELTA
jgi:hypothetical protein